MNLRFSEGLGICCHSYPAQKKGDLLDCSIRLSPLTRDLKVVGGYGDPSTLLVSNTKGHNHLQTRSALCDCKKSKGTLSVGSMIERLVAHALKFF